MEINNNNKKSNNNKCDFIGLTTFQVPTTQFIYIYIYIYEFCFLIKK